jgi:lipid II:glycine glycyltransferase (peptidoglycan interpeptide bridge formation enzyme)
VYVGYVDNRPVAALLLFYFNKTVEYFTPVVREEFRSLQPTSLIIYEAMKDAIRDSYDKWNWGGTWLSQGSVYDFKKRWGAAEKRYYYYTRVYNKEIIGTDKETLIKSYPNFFLLPFNQLQS